MYNYLFGPVPSRRLGISLGVDLVTHKTCSLNCIYCECGETTDLTIKREEYVSADKVIGELDHYFQNNPDPDYITFSGSGEPCLNSRIGEVIEYIKNKKQKVAVAVLTNGTLLSDPQVRKDLLQADLVIPSLDAASRDVFNKINRPCEELDIETYIKGLEDFRAEYNGRIHLEILILPEINNSTEEVRLLKNACEKIRPDMIQLNTLDRPGAITGIRAASNNELQQIVEAFKPLKAEIIAAAFQRKKVQSYRNDMASAIIETIQRRPCTVKDLAEILGTHVNEINKYLAALEQEDKIEPITQQRGVFYQTKTREK
ncbi:MAG: radical SAM protein [Desulfobacteraceae bacterium]